MKRSTYTTEKSRRELSEDYLSLVHSTSHFNVPGGFSGLGKEIYIHVIHECTSPNDIRQFLSIGTFSSALLYHTYLKWAVSPAASNCYVLTNIPTDKVILVCSRYTSLFASFDVLLIRTSFVKHTSFVSNLRIQNCCYVWKIFYLCSCKVSIHLKWRDRTLYLYGLDKTTIMNTLLMQDIVPKLLQLLISTAHSDEPSFLKINSEDVSVCSILSWMLIRSSPGLLFEASHATSHSHQARAMAGQLLLARLFWASPLIVFCLRFCVFHIASDFFVSA